uniref:Transmembrane domain containing protein n=1 Tax=Marseillevirus sp. TaxID=2809551 RepID=A0AA96EJP9_9VIRU|nr:transmembrane domain containing protein [Marseillevirus sp.]
MSCKCGFWKFYALSGVMSSSYVMDDLADLRKTGRTSLLKDFVLFNLSAFAWPIFLPLFVRLKEKKKL